MSKKLGTILVVLTVLAALTIFGCGRRMDDLEYDIITEEFIDEFVLELFSSEDWDDLDDVDQLAEKKLEEVLERHNYTVEQYRKKGEQLGETWDDLWDRIEYRINREFERILLDLDVEEIEFDAEL